MTVTQSRAPRIVHLTSVHSAHDTRIMRECVTLARNGFDVALVGRNRGDEMIDGVRVHAIPTPHGRLQRMTKTVFAVYQKARALNAHIYHFHDPELLPVGLMLERQGAHVIYDVHEDLPRQILGKTYLRAFLRPSIAAAVELFTRRASGFLSGIVCAWPNISATFDHPHIALVQNYPYTDEFASAERVPFARRENLVVYYGGLADSRGLRTMLQAMELVRVPDAKLLLAGRFFDTEAERWFADAHDPARVEYLGWADHARIRELLARSKVGLSLLHPLPNYVETMSTKVFEYMSAGVPIVLSHFPRWREIVDRTGCGFAVDPLDPHSIAAAIERLLLDAPLAETMGRRGAQAVRERYNWESEAVRLLTLYRTLGVRP